MEPFDVFIVYSPWESGGKSRPVLAYIIDGDKFYFYQITTQYENKSTTIKNQYFKITDWQQAGLNKPSYIDIGTLLKLPLSVTKNKSPIGKLTQADKKRLLEFLARRA